METRKKRMNLRKPKHTGQAFWYKPALQLSVHYLSTARTCNQIKGLPMQMHLACLP